MHPSVAVAPTANVHRTIAGHKAGGAGLRGAAGRRRALRTVEHGLEAVQCAAVDRQRRGRHRARGSRSNRAVNVDAGRASQVGDYARCWCPQCWSGQRRTRERFVCQRLRIARRRDVRRRDDG